MAKETLEVSDRYSSKEQVAEDVKKVLDDMSEFQPEVKKVADDRLKVVSAVEIVTITEKRGDIEVSVDCPDFTLQGIMDRIGGASKNRVSDSNEMGSNGGYSVLRGPDGDHVVMADSDARSMQRGNIVERGMTRSKAEDMASRLNRKEQKKQKKSGTRGNTTSTGGRGATGRTSGTGKAASMELHEDGTLEVEMGGSVEKYDTDIAFILNSNGEVELMWHDDNVQMDPEKERRVEQAIRDELQNLF